MKAPGTTSHVQALVSGPKLKHLPSTIHCGPDDSHILSHTGTSLTRFLGFQLITVFTVDLSNVSSERPLYTPASKIQESRLLNQLICDFPAFHFALSVFSCQNLDTILSQ